MSRSNSRAGRGFFGGWSVGAFGIDTVSYAFRPTSPEPLRAFSALPSRRLTRRERGDSRWATQVVNGVKIGAFPTYGLLVTEGRLSPMLSGDLEDRSLASPASLVAGGERAREAFAHLGVEIDERPVMRRIDLAAELRFDDPADGLLVLRAFEDVRLPPLAQNRRKSPNANTETVAWESGGRIVLRLYDAGDHHGTDAPGFRLRLERQSHPRKVDQQPPESFALQDLSALFLGRLAALTLAMPTIQALPPRQAEIQIFEQARDAGLSLAKAERRLGMIRVSELGQALPLWGSKAPDRNREMRNAGILLDHSALRVEPWDLRPLLEAVASPWRDLARQRT